VAAELLATSQRLRFLRCQRGTFSVHNGVTYLFSSAEAKGMFDKDPAGAVAKADKAWANLR